MTVAETKQWWIHYRAELPSFTDENDKARVEDLTGSIPLLLSPLFSYAQKEFVDIQDKFWAHPLLRTVLRNITVYARRYLEEEKRDAYEEFYLGCLRACLMNDTCPVASTECDYRYFDVDYLNPGGCTCGLARDKAAVLLREANTGEFLRPEWDVLLCTNNPSILGFIVEQRCLGVIAKIGITGPIALKRAKVYNFDGDTTTLEPTNPGLYIPLKFDCRAIDAVYLDVDPGTQVARVVAIRITVGKSHSDSETSFYSRWSKWTRELATWTIESTFLWITANDKAQTNIEWKLSRRPVEPGGIVASKSRMLRRARKGDRAHHEVLLNPEYRPVWMTLDAVSKVHFLHFSKYVRLPLDP